MISLTHSQELQPMQSLGRLKKTPPSISIHSLGPPVPDSQPFCILRHLIHPSEAWSSSASSALRLIQGDFLHGRLACIRTTCPAHLSLFILIVVTKSTSSYKLYSSSLYFDLHVASSQMGPKILLSIFLSNTPRRNSSALLKTQVSAPYIRIGFINVLYMITLYFLFMFLALNYSPSQNNFYWLV